MVIRFVISAWLAAGAPGAGPIADPSMKTVLSRLEKYVVAYEPALSALVARERYVQIEPGTAGARGHTRTLVSDFLFFRSPGRNGPWLGFRDVLEVDGTPVENQGGRLRDILASPDSAESRALTMARENARYNIGRFVRTVNVPVCIVAWMHPDMRDRFSFKHAGEDDIDGVRVWRVEFKEKDRPTLVRTPEGRSIPTTGRLWINPATGQVLQTEQQNTLDTLQVHIQVRFSPHPELGVLVPTRMVERYDDGVDRLETEALYTDYRRFTATARIR